MKAPYRPILEIPKTKAEKIFDVIGIGVFLLSILYIVIKWNQIPDEIPAHFNAAGDVNRWGSKMEIIILPIMGFFLFVLMSLLEKAPHMHNYPKRINESNAHHFYLNSRIILNSTKNTCLFVFAYLNTQIFQIALGTKESLGNLFLPLFLIAVFVPIVIGLYKQSKIK